MGHWLVVLGEVEGLRWVLKNREMAFTAARRSLALQVEPGHRLVLYVSRGAYHNPTRDSSQIIALATARSRVKDLEEPIGLAGREFVCACSLKIDVALQERAGVPIKTVIRKLSFVKRPEVWGQYFRRSLVSIGASDFHVLERALLAAKGSEKAEVGVT